MVAFDEMKGKLLTLDQVQERISSTEPLGQQHLSTANKIYFDFEPDWALGLEAKDGTTPVNAVIRVNGVDHRLTKDAALQAGASFGLPGKYAAKVPSNFLAPQLNYWFSGGMGDHEFNMLTTGQDQAVAAFTKATIQPFSNQSLVNEVVNGIRERYGNEEIFADYKFNHSLVKTDIRFIVPNALRHITGGGLADVPHGQTDEWAGGIHLTNSLMGKSQTRLETYLFRWWCTNGCTTTMPDMGVWSRRGDQDTTDVYEWARTAVDDVLGGLEVQFDRIQALTSLNVGDNVGDIVRDIFDQFNVPVSQRQGVIDTLVEAENLSMYTVQNAISQTANDPDINPERVDKITRIAGAVIGSTFNSIKAQVWREGHIADPEAANPYEIGHNV